MEQFKRIHFPSGITKIDSVEDDDFDDLSPSFETPTMEDLIKQTADTMP